MNAKTKFLIGGAAIAATAVGFAAPAAAQYYPGGGYGGGYGTGNVLLGTILDQILPISRRWRGMLNDAKLAGHPARVDLRQLRVPLLLLSADDDRFGTAPTARAISMSPATASVNPRARQLVATSSARLRRSAGARA